MKTGVAIQTSNYDWDNVLFSHRCFAFVSTLTGTGRDVLLQGGPL